MTTIIHVNRHMIAANKKDGGNRPVFSIKNGSKTTYAQGVHIDGPSWMTYNPSDPLQCGASVWIETQSPVELWGETQFKDITNASQ